MNINHGIHKISLEGSMVIFRAQGAYNLDGIKEYEQTFARLVSPLKGRNWGILNIFPDFETGGPEVISRIKKQYQWCIENGCQYIGFYTTSPLHDFFARKTVDGIGLKEYGIFSNEADAKAWMESKLELEAVT